MAALDALTACAGRWVGTSRLQDPHSGVQDDSPSTVVVNPVLGGRFARLDYDWAYRFWPSRAAPSGDLVLAVPLGPVTIPP